ncbi:uncharacterized protein LOC121425534 [Lytechinus variegatus]|uniref:uncharacterized protein LOC121425534 n=1 Tax=Lytechinus variegatus TaxID=7654 RepID=UPI001BB26190|nr:uncharacterized protein LOC121425534 [Lytechinus variegatus]
MDLAGLMAAGKEFGLTGEALKKFVSDEQKKQRDERAELLELKKREKETAEIQLEIEREKNVKGESKSVGQRAWSPKLPPFHEDKDNIDAYLQRFERYADTQNWPRADWAINLSALLTGKALDVHSRLTSDEAKDYKTLKTSLLKAFQLTSEGFRSKFYTGKPVNGETASQYSNRLENYLNRWIELSGVKHDFDDLKDLLLREHFINGCHRDLSIFLRERQPKTTKDAMKFTEQYLEARGGVFRAPPPQRNIPTGQTQRINTRHEGKTNTPQIHSKSFPKTCYNCHQEGHISRNCPKQSQKPQMTKTCFICHRPGHFANSCPFSPVKSAGFVISEEPEEPEDRPATEADPTHLQSDNPGYIPHNPCRCISCNTQVRLEASCIMVRMPNDTPHLKSMTDYDKFGYDNSLPLMSAACSNENFVKRMPVTKGLVNNNVISVLRDSGSSGIIIKQDLVKQSQLTGEVCTCLLIDRSIRTLPIAVIDINTPFYVGKVSAVCMKTPLYDLILGNIPGVRPAEQPDPQWTLPETVIPVCAVQTRAQVQREGKPFRPLKTPHPMEEVVIPSVLKETQQKDETLHRLRELADAGTEKVS